MFIVWGKKRVERNQGLVADFCPICREVRAFQLMRVGVASHVYYMSLGEGKLAGHIIRCNECRVQLAVDPTRYASTEKDPQIGLEVLVRDTFPKLREVYAARLELETRIKRTRSALSADEYQRFLMEPFACWRRAFLRVNGVPRTNSRQDTVIDCDTRGHWNHVHLCSNAPRSRALFQGTRVAVAGEVVEAVGAAARRPCSLH